MMGNTAGLDFCPECGSDDLTWDHVDIDDPYAHQPVFCDTCGCRWQTNYKFDSYTVVSHGDTCQADAEQPTD